MVDPRPRYHARRYLPIVNSTADTIPPYNAGVHGTFTSGIYLNSNVKSPMMTASETTKFTTLQNQPTPSDLTMDASIVLMIRDTSSRNPVPSTSASEKNRCLT